MKVLLIAIVFLLAGCAKYEQVSSANESYLYYSKHADFDVPHMIRITEEDMYYNLYFNSRYYVEYEKQVFQTIEEIMELIDLIGPDALYNIGYKMERIEIGAQIWDRNFNVENINY